MAEASMLAGKTVLITGAGRGLGAAFAVVLADLGASPILAARSKNKLDEVANAIANRGHVRPPIVELDLADPRSVHSAADCVLNQSDTLDVLINNGAQWLEGALRENAPEDIVSTVNSQVTGTALLTRALLPALEASGAGDILNIVSTSGLPNAALRGASSVFAAAKHGQMGFSDGLRQELRDSTVRVLSISPPDLEDLSPLLANWHEAQPSNGMITSRDVVEAGVFALMRPRHVTVAAINLDAKTRGLHG